MSWPNAFSVASTVSAVPGGPMIGSGAGSGPNVVIQRVINTVAEIGDVVAVQVGQQQRGQRVGARARRRQALLHSSTAVDQEGLPARAHKRRGARAPCVGNRTAGAEQRDLNHDVIPTAFGHVRK